MVPVATRPGNSPCEWLETLDLLAKANSKVPGDVAAAAAVVAQVVGEQETSASALQEHVKDLLHRDPGNYCVARSFSCRSGGALAGEMPAQCDGTSDRTRCWMLEFEVFSSLVGGEKGPGPNDILLFDESMANTVKPAPKNVGSSSNSSRPKGAPPVLSSSLKKAVGSSKSLAGEGAVAKEWTWKDMEESSAGRKCKAGTALVPKGPGWRPLCMAAHEGRIELAAMLIAAGADVHLQCDTENGPSPVHLAAAGGHTGMVKLLVRYGAHLGKRDGRGLTPLQAAVRAGKRDHQHLAALDCGHGPHRCMAGWGSNVVLGICPSESSCDEDAATLLRVYTQAAGEWERHVGRKLLEVAPTKEGLSPGISAVIQVAFGEWNRKNGYTRPVVRQNRWPFERTGAKIYLRKRPAEEVAPRTIEQAMVHTACHELGHALGLPHHSDTGELMHFLGLGGGLEDAWTSANANVVDFGPACTAAGKWLYHPRLPKTATANGRATLCLSCYSPGWWEASARGGMSLKIEAGEWLSKAKHKNFRRRMEALPDGTMRLVTEDGNGNEDDEEGEEFVDGDDDDDVGVDDDSKQLVVSAGGGTAVTDRGGEEEGLVEGAVRAVSLDENHALDGGGAGNYNGRKSDSSLCVGGASLPADVLRSLGGNAF